MDATRSVGPQEPVAVHPCSLHWSALLEPHEDLTIYFWTGVTIKAHTNGLLTPCSA